MEVEQNKVIKTCLLAGKIMVEGGSEIYRVEDTMRTIIYHASNHDSQIFATLTGVLVTMDLDDSTIFGQIKQRGIDLEKIDAVNELSRQYTADKINLDQLYQKLQQTDHKVINFPIFFQAIGAAIESMLLMIIFTQNYDWFDMPLAAVAGGIGYVVSELIGKHSRIRFVSEFMGSIALGFVAIAGVNLGLGQNVNNVIIGAVMPLVPGVPITNALRDIIEGNLLSGIERGIEASLTVFAIACAIAALFHYL